MAKGLFPEYLILTLMATITLTTAQALTGKPFNIGSYALLTENDGRGLPVIARRVYSHLR
jgi:hypothetical protein